MSIILTIMLLCSGVDDCLKKADNTYGNSAILYTQNAIIFAIQDLKEDLKEDINNIK